MDDNFDTGKKKQNESILDFTLLKRLFGFAKEYSLLMIFAVFLLLVITGLQLFRPFITGYAIDQVIEAYLEPYTMIDYKHEGAVFFKGNYYIKKKKYPFFYKWFNIKEQEMEIKGDKKALIIHFKNKYYFFNNINNDEVKFLLTQKKFEKNENQISVFYENKTLSGEYLKPGDLKILRSGDIKMVVFYGILFIVLLILGFTITYIQVLILQFTGQKIIYNIRNKVFTHIHSLTLKFFDKNPTGRLVTRVTNDTETINEMYTNVIANSLKNIFIVIGIIIAMLVIKIKLSLIILSVLPLVFIATFIFRKIARENYRSIRLMVSRLNSFLSEHISGMKLIQIFNVEKKIFNMFDKVSKKLTKSYVNEIVIFGLFKPLTFVFHIAALCLLILFGGNEVIKGTIKIGLIYTFMQYVNTLFRPINELAEQFNILQAAMAASEKIFNLLDTKPLIKQSKDSIVLEEIKGHLEFKNVWFAYKPGDWVLKDVSFTINPGEAVAFVGATGAGKTSIINLICRYYDIQKGQILIDGIDIKKINIKSLRKNIGQVMQDVFLFTGTIKSNICLKDETICEEKIRDVSKYVNADRFINRLDNEYEHEVLERGATLSAGERQLISFARALAFNPSIMVLDEATANIDTETEIYIQDALNKILSEKTSIVIAHRLSTIQHSDKIIVLHKGKICETGTHQELLKNKSIYYNLYKLQYS